jgi:hypothetical protein
VSTAEREQLPRWWAVLVVTAVFGGLAALGAVLPEWFESPPPPEEIDALAAAPATAGTVIGDGRWEREGPVATLEEPGPGPGHQIYLLGNAPPVPPLTFGARAAPVVEGWGFAFALESPEDYWAIEASPDEAAWTLVRVIGGTRTIVDRGEGPVAGDPTVGISVGAFLRVTVDGQLVLEHPFGAPPEGSYGLALAGRGEGVRWEQILVAAG